QVERLKKDLIAKAVKKGDITIVKAVVMLDAAPAKDLVFKIREAIPEKLICVVGATSQGRPSLNVMLSDDMVAEGLNAGKLVREAAKLIQGGGGGQPHFAQAGGKNVDGIKAAVDKVVELIKE
ncbi:MAG: DHHA1 domain-containing protein, partial [Prevotella sp.]|nr:DHHA1 domain-containing protein [Prevotella sp.]